MNGSDAVINAGTGGGNLSIDPGILAQSIGGGGGTGGHSDGWFAVGGNGVNAVNGNAVQVSLTYSTITTYGLQSDAIAAQSIDGGGGKGGAATTAKTNDSGGSVAIGGNGNLAGDGSSVNVTNSGSIITIGPLAVGITPPHAKRQVGSV